MKVVVKSSVVDNSKVCGWLTPHTEYLVLAVEVSATGELAYRIESEDYLRQSYSRLWIIVYL